jgi:hypothetical protein
LVESIGLDLPRASCGTASVVLGEGVLVFLVRGEVRENS